MKAIHIVASTLVAVSLLAGCSREEPEPTPLTAPENTRQVPQDTNNERLTTPDTTTETPTGTEGTMGTDGTYNTTQERSGTVDGGTNHTDHPDADNNTSTTE